MSSRFFCPLLSEHIKKMDGLLPGQVINIRCHRPSHAAGPGHTIIRLHRPSHAAGPRTGRSWHAYTFSCACTDSFPAWYCVASGDPCVRAGRSWYTRCRVQVSSCRPPFNPLGVRAGRSWYAFTYPTQAKMQESMDVMVNRSRMVDGIPTSLADLGCVARALLSSLSLIYIFVSFSLSL